MWDMIVVLLLFALTLLLHLLILGSFSTDLLALRLSSFYSNIVSLYLGKESSER